MASKKNPPPLQVLPPLPIRIARLHGKLIVAAAIWVLVAVLIPDAWRMPTRLLIGWDVGVACYLVLTHTMIWRADVAHLRKRAAE